MDLVGTHQLVVPLNLVHCDRMPLNHIAAEAGGSASVNWALERVIGRVVQMLQQVTNAVTFILKVELGTADRADELLRSAVPEAWKYEASVPVAATDSPMVVDVGGMLPQLFE